MRHRAITNSIYRPKWWKSLGFYSQTMVVKILALLLKSCVAFWASLSNNLLFKWLFPWESREGVCHCKSVARLRDVVWKHSIRVSQSRCSINGKIVIFNNLLHVTISWNMFSCSLTCLPYSYASLKATTGGLGPLWNLFWPSLQLSFLAEVLIPSLEP